jgi:hypothetical protein
MYHLELTKESYEILLIYLNSPSCVTVEPTNGRDLKYEFIVDIPRADGLSLFP